MDAAETQRLREMRDVARNLVFNHKGVRFRAYRDPHDRDVVIVDVDVREEDNNASGPVVWKTHSLGEVDSFEDLDNWIGSPDFLNRAGVEEPLSERDLSYIETFIGEFALRLNQEEPLEERVING